MKSKKYAAVAATVIIDLVTITVIWTVYTHFMKVSRYVSTYKINFSSLTFCRYFIISYTMQWVKEIHK